MKNPVFSCFFIAATCFQMLFAQPTTSTTVIKQVAGSKHDRPASLSMSGLPAHAILRTPSVFAVNSLSPFKKMGFANNPANNINIKAVRDFVRTFRNVENNKWRLADDGTITSTFVSNEISTSVSYDCRGNRVHIIRTYDEYKLPRKLRDMVKREYYDATITLVKEYETDRRVIIYVHMQDKYTWKIVRIMNGEMQLEQSLNKG